MNRHIMFDFETFGQKVNSCAVINCALCLFDLDRLTSDNPYTFEELINDHVKLLKLDVEHQVKECGFKIEKGALEFWQSLDRDVQKQIKPRPDDLRLDEFCRQVLDFLKGGKIERWWSRGNNFDPIILMRLFDTCGMLDDIENVLKFWLLRDERTYVDAMTGFGLKKNNFNPLSDEENEIFKPHNAVHDVAMGVMRIQYLERNA